MKLLQLLPLYLLLACFALTGCAKNEMTLTLSLYDHDPRAQIPLTPNQTSKLLVELEDIEMGSDELYDAQVEHATALLEFAKTYVRELTPISTNDLNKDKPETRSSIQTAVAKYDDIQTRHERTLTDKHDKVKQEVATAREHIINYVNLRNELALLEENKAGNNEDRINQIKSSVITERSRISSALVKVTIASLEQSRPLGDDFNKVLNPRLLAISIRGVSNLLANKTNDAPEHANIVNLFDSLNKLLNTIESHSKNIAQQTSKLKTQVTEAQESLNTPGAPLARSASLIAKAATATPTELKISDRGATALNSLARSSDLLFSQIDRLQDPADPVLRIITNPENEEHWNTDPKFSKTHFYAEGDSSVVIVRDAPNSFRVQRGDNDPSALVQSQLIVSRAVGDAAITVAGAAAGLHLPTFGGGSDDNNTPLAPTDHSDADTFAENRAQAKAQAEMMQRVTLAFRTELQIFRRELATAATQKEKDLLIRELSGKLTSYKTFYEEGNL